MKFGDFVTKSARNRKGEYDTQVVKKNQTELGGIEQQMVVAAFRVLVREIVIDCVTNGRHKLKDELLAGFLLRNVYLAASQSMELSFISSISHALMPV